MNRIELLTNCFYTGKYDSIVNELGRKLTSVDDPHFETLTSLQIGALIFLGESLEAQSLFELCLKKSVPSDLFLCRCRFYLSIGYIRRSAYSEASRTLTQNLIDFTFKLTDVHLSRNLSEFVWQSAGIPGI